MLPPVAASIMRRRAVRRPNVRMARERTDRVGKRLMRGAMRIDPTHLRYS